MVSRDTSEQGDFGKDDPLLSLKATIEIQRRLQADPNAVSDEEIDAEYGGEPDASTVRELFRKTTFGRPPKDGRASARAKLRRRLIALAAAFEAVEGAVEEVLSSPGRINKPQDLEHLKQAIIDFRAATSLAGYGSALPSVDLGMFDLIMASPPVDWSVPTAASESVDND
jgi:hypothetical protein